MPLSPQEITSTTSEITGTSSELFDFVVVFVVDDDFAIWNDVTCMSRNA